MKKKSLLKKLFEKAPPAFTKEEKAPQNSHRAKGLKGADIQVFRRKWSSLDVKNKILFKSYNHQKLHTFYKTQNNKNHF